MQSQRDYWPAWIESLQNWKLDSFVAWLLDAVGPITLLGAQALNFSRPFINSQQLEAVARMLEEDDEVEAFVAYLHGESAP